MTLALAIALGAVVALLVFAIRRGIEEQQEHDAIADSLEYEDEDSHFSGASVTPAPSQPTPIEARASRPADSFQPL